jgi:hypothetical protein
VFCVIIDEFAQHAIEVADGDRSALDLQPALDQLARARADHVARGGERDRRQALAVEHEIQRVDQVRRGIDQRAVEIEYDYAGRSHGRSRYRSERTPASGQALKWL